jgi:hypothetical protein
MVRQAVITIAYITNRKICHINWFFQSLYNQLLLQPVYPEIKVCVVDHWAEAYGHWTEIDVAKRKYEFSKMAPFPIHHVPPKPTVWSGKYRLTTQNYFSPSNSRNTGLCMSEGSHIVYVDDLSVLLPGWLDSVLEAQKGGYIACGTYRKVLNLNVVDGNVLSFDDHPSGHDSRKQFFKSDEPFPAGGSWMYGCSVAIRTEALLEINGWDENCDSCGAEDTITGIILDRKGNKFMMCPKMLSYEDELAHHVETPFKRIIKPKEGWKDSSHMILHQAIHGESLWFPNYQNMRETRDIVLNGGAFPIVQIPEHHYIDGQSLRDM